VDFDYPVASTPVRSAIADAVRTAFRTAVRIAVTGSPWTVAALLADTW